MSGATHVWACTPLVTEVIGISSWGTSGQRSLNISRLTSPWSLATAFDRPASRRPMTAMLNRSSGVSPGRWPSSMSSSSVIPTSLAQSEK